MNKFAIIEITTRGFIVRGVAPWHRRDSLLGFDEAAIAVVGAARSRIAQGRLNQRNKRMHVVARVETRGHPSGDPSTTTLADFTLTAAGTFSGKAQWSRAVGVADVTAGAAFRVLDLLQKARK